MAVTMKSTSALDRINAGMQASVDARKAAEDRKKAGSNGLVSVASSLVLLKSGKQKDGREIIQRAYIRPIYNIDVATVVSMHDKFQNYDASGNRAPIANLCAEAYGHACKYCVDAKKNKLQAREECFIAVYLRGIEEQEVGQTDWSKVQYTFKNPEGQEEKKTVQGFKLLRLKMNSPILSGLMNIFKYSGDITSCTYIIQRQGEELGTTYTLEAQPPTPMNPNLKAAIAQKKPSQVLELIEQLYPYQIVPQSRPNNGPLEDEIIDVDADVLDALDETF